MTRLPRHYAPFLYGIIQSGLTTAIATAIATLQTAGFGLQFVMHWLWAWGLAWLAMLPIVVFAAPLIQRLVFALIHPDRVSSDPSWKLPDIHQSSISNTYRWSVDVQGLALA